MKTQHIFAYADDREEDREMFKLALKRTGLLNPLVLLSDGEEVTHYLEGAGPFCDRLQYPLPAILFIDLKMPKMTGIEVTRWIRSRNEFRKLIILLFSGSGQQPDIDDGYAAGANSYIIKPFGLKAFCTLLQTTHAYWCGVASPPASLAADDHGLVRVPP